MKRREGVLGRGSASAGLLLAWLAGACNLVDAKVANLNEVHEPDGTPSRVGKVQTDTMWLISRFMNATNFRSQNWDPTKEEAIEDPLGVCLENLLGLADANANDRRPRGLMVENFAWLGADCTYALSRERCAIELGKLGERIELEGAVEPPEAPAGPAELGPPLTGVLEAATAILSRRDEREALAKHCAEVRALELDLDGSRRVLRSSTALLGRGGFNTGALRPLRELHEEVERRCIALALTDLTDDEDPRVRGAGVLAYVKATGNRCPEILRAGLLDPEPDVRRYAALAVRRFGLPVPPAGLSEEERAAEREEWLVLLLDLLRYIDDGRVAVETCKALAVLTGRPETLRPEDWIAWWEEREVLSTPGAADGPVEEGPQDHG